MHLNVFLIEKLAAELSAKFTGKTLVESFTTAINEVYFVFENEAIRCQFYKGELFYQFPDINQLQKSNRLPSFQQLIGKKVVGIEAVELDRGFLIQFESSEALAFFNYGRFGLISSFVEENEVERFPLKSNSSEFPKTKNLPWQDIQNAADLKTKFGFVSMEDANNLQYPLTKERWDNYLSEKRVINGFDIYKESDVYSLNVEKGEVFKSYASLKEALHNFTALFISSDTFLNIKSQAVTNLNRKNKSLNNQLKKLQKVAPESRQYSYKQKADLLMANLHVLESGMKTVTLRDFENTADIQIALNSKLTGQANAERYYRKAKNQYKEEEIRQQKIKNIQDQITQNQILISEAESSASFKDLKRFTKKVVPKDDGIRLPYRVFTIEGIEVRVGKGAKDNDELIRSYCKSNDLWLHAKGVSGSHVIAVTRGKELPVKILETIASIAAYYSKAKSESLAAVIYTPRKYVRKPKGALPGAVLVEREDVLLVEPKLP